jgi:hypothetical protein
MSFFDTTIDIEYINHLVLYDKKRVKLTVNYIGTIGVAKIKFELNKILYTVNEMGK